MQFLSNHLAQRFLNGIVQIDRDARLASGKRRQHLTQRAQLRGLGGGQLRAVIIGRYYRLDLLAIALCAIAG